MKYLILTFLIILSSCESTSIVELTKAQIEKDMADIKEVLHQQASDWSNASIADFMEGYDKTPNLLFVGKSGITKGWQQTMDRYKAGYPTKDHTGKLTFDVLDVQPINAGAYLLVGEFHLIRNVGKADGIFTLVFKRINGDWKVIADHTSAYDNEKS